MSNALVLVLDGLRPDMLRPDLLPNLCTLIDEGTRWRQARTVFPSMTRVCTSSLASGAPPAVHGITHNKLLDPELGTVDTSSRADLGRIEAVRPLLDATTLGEALAAAGRRFAVVHTGSPGATHLVNHKVAEHPGHWTWSAHGPEACSSAELHEAIARQFGPTPEAGLPNHARLAFATDILLERVLEPEAAELALVWFNEPDTSYHYKGLRSLEVVEVLATLDRQIGRILAWWRRADIRERWTIAVLSDHGHVLTGEQIDLPAAFAEAGLDPDGQGGFDLVPGGTSGHLRLRDLDPARLAEIAHWLMLQPWCGHVLVRDDLARQVPGALPLGAVTAGHPRASDLHFTLRGGEEDLASGAGAAFFTGGVPSGGGMHGGLHPRELANVIALAGPGIRTGRLEERPAGLIDVAPSLLGILGVDRPASMTGRVLQEAFSAAGEPPETILTTHEAAHGSYRQSVRIATIGSAAYVDAAHLAPAGD
ncbi:alkaline phosphatase family protein [Geminicoccaceae bacterium 1502E]|nr:alkaline phosphatase family protein [Geminicoccaceae bacterium 1502E]